MSWGTQEIWLALIAPEPRHAHCGAELMRFRIPALGYL
jgi:hypothetical protein